CLNTWFLQRSGIFPGLSFLYSSNQTLHTTFREGNMTTMERIDHAVTLVSGMIVGATAMYILDESRGAKRPAYARDKLIRAGHLLGRTIRKRSRDLMHRFSGAAAEIRSSIRDRGTPIPDDILISRVRARLGHV